MTYGSVWLFFLVIFSAQAQDSKEPGEPYGWPDGKKRIQQAMLTGDSTRISQTIFSARNQRGISVGMAIQDPIYRAPDSSEIDKNEVEKIWNGVVDQWMVWEPNCPETSMDAPAATLGLAFGSLGKSLVVPQENLRNLLQLLRDQQYISSNCLISTGIVPGAFGISQVPVEEPCFVAGSSQRFAQSVCQSYPILCPTYSGGLFAGKKFAVADQALELDFLDGGLTPTQAWGVLEMIYGHLTLGDSAFFQSAKLGANWCLQEKPMANSSQTARLVWALASWYEATGDSSYYLALKNRVFHHLCPAILMDKNADGLVDGMKEIAFSQLVPYSNSPGRIWDGQNASSWNSAVAASALCYSYAALRNRLDSVDANQVRPYLEAMMNNLCREIIQSGTPPLGSGFRELCFAILEIHYHLSVAEGLYKPDWDKAIRIVWNARVVQRGAEYSVNVGQFVRYLEGGKRYYSISNLLEGKK